MSPLDKTVLVVEDNDVHMKLYHAVLEPRGYNDLQAKDGTEGWRIAREHRPDLILMEHPRWLRRLYRQADFSSQLPADRRASRQAYRGRAGSRVKQRQLGARSLSPIRMAEA